MKAQNPKKRRPIWVWLISIFYLGFGLSGLMAVAMALVIFSQGKIPEGEIESLNTLMRSSLWGMLPAVNIAGAISLFLLRKIALPIFSVLLIVKLGLQLFFENTLAAAFSGGNAEMIIGYGLGYGILLAVCIYTWRLKKAGILK